jgi:hypothetical protein
VHEVLVVARTLDETPMQEGRDYWVAPLLDRETDHHEAVTMKCGRPFSSYFILPARRASRKG